MCYINLPTREFINIANAKLAALYKKHRSMSYDVSDITYQNSD